MRTERNSSLQAKLKSYSVITAGMLAAGNAGAQIVHHTLVNGDTVLNTFGQSYYLDLNGDGKNDFEFIKGKEDGYSGAFFTELNPYCDNSAMGTVHPSDLNSVYNRQQNAFAIGPGSKIGPVWQYYENPWLGCAAQFRSYGPYGILAFPYKLIIGFWYFGRTKDFIGLRIRSDTGYNYGWVRCTVAKRGTGIIIYDYAYQMIADSPIIAGDTGIGITGIKNHTLGNVIVYTTGRNLLIKYANAMHDGLTLSLTDEAGRKIREGRIYADNYELSLANYAAGIYFITLKSKGSVLTRKIILQ